MLLDNFALGLLIFVAVVLFCGSTEHFHHVGVIRKVLLRMAARMSYVLPLH
jgi:hypothetical protein